MAVVLDVNVFVSAALSKAGAPHTLVQAMRDGQLEVIVSPLLLAELDEVLRRPMFRRFFTLEEVDQLLEEIARICEVVPDPEPGAAVLRDADDDYLVYLARHVGAEFIVSGDADLTDADIDPPAITPRAALDTFEIR